MTIPAVRLGRRTLLAAGAQTISIALVSPGPVRAASDPVVETVHGRLRGLAGPGVAVFKGIRYGATTGGANRFCPPVQAEPWAGIRDAQAWGASAPQIPGATYPIAAWYTAIEPISEDCLFVNVFTPGLQSGARKPVMVWFHGGAWMNCAGTAPGFDGTNLARDGDAVVVTVNHRINIFGHILLEGGDPRFADAANTGVLDMVASLQWVRDNIEVFGGDPSNVTIFGQSGGAAKVATLLAFPPAKGLFHKAIMQSFSGGQHLRSPEDAARMAHDVAAAAGLPKADPSALQAVPMDRLIATMQTMTDAVYPILDGKNFTHDPYDPALPASAAGIPLLIGNAATEATWFMGGNLKNFALEDADARLRIGRYLAVDQAAVSRIIDAYRAGMPKATPTGLLIAIVTDYQFRKNTTHMAALKAGQGSAPVYTYVFDWQTHVYGGVLRSPHTVEVPFVFGTTQAAVAEVGTAADLGVMTHTTQSTWSEFARKGDPNNAALPHWPTYDVKGRQTMMIGPGSVVASNPGGEAREALRDLPAYEYSVPLSYIHA